MCDEHRQEAPSAEASETRVEANPDKLARRGRGGLSARYWGEAIELHGERIEQDYDLLIAAPAEERPKLLRRLHADIHLLLIASSHLLRCLSTSAEVLDDAAIREVKQDFDERAPHIRYIRDVLEHLDEYDAGKGRLVKKGELPPGAQPILVFKPFNEADLITVMLGRHELAIRRLVSMLPLLAERLDQAWEERFGPDEDIAMWGRSG